VPSIAAVIPAHNREQLVARAIDSVLAQKRRPDEIVVVDDGSTDDTAEVVARYGEPVTLVRQANGGVSAARNAGVARCTSDFVALLDSDDFWEQAHLGRMERAVDATGGKAWVYFSDIRLDERRGGGSLWSQCGFAPTGAFELRDDREWLFRELQPILLQASLVRRAAYLAVGGCAPELVRRQDTHLIFKLGLGGPICAVAGLAGTRTADDAEALTRLYPPDHTVYAQCTAWLYRDLLRRPADLTPAQRRIFVRRLAEAHFELARRSGLRKPVAMLRHLALLHRLDPGMFVSRLGTRIRRVWPGATPG
jgi:glycosyltransferase involved in cell wall biosynthesis